MLPFLPACASEQGKVIGLVSVYITRAKTIKDVGLLMALKKNKNNGDVDLTPSQKNSLKTDKYMTAIATSCTVNQCSEYKDAHYVGIAATFICQFSDCFFFFFCDRVSSTSSLFSLFFF